MEFSLKQWKYKPYDAFQGTTCEFNGSTMIWKLIEKMVDDYHYPSFRLRNNLFPQAHVCIDLEKYVDTRRKDIGSLSKINEATIQRFTEAHTRYTTLINTIFPKMEKYEKGINQSITSYGSSL